MDLWCDPTEPSFYFKVLTLIPLAKWKKLKEMSDLKLLAQHEKTAILEQLSFPGDSPFSAITHLEDVSENPGCVV